MKVNIEKSLYLKKKYNHRINQCYKNAYRLFMSDEIECIVYGYCTSDNKIFIRHAWGVKEGEIIDSTFRKHELLDTRYYKSFKIRNIKELIYAMKNTEGFAMLGLFEEDEKENKEEIIKKFGSVNFF